MTEINFKKIDKQNFNDVIELSNTLNADQQKNVAKNVYSIAESTLVPNNAYYRAIYLDETLIGFFMLYIPDEKSIEEGVQDLYLWRLMIASKYQYKGYGRKVLDKIITYGKSLGYKKLLLSYELGPESPGEFYLKYGFKPDDKTYGREIGLSYIIEE